LNETDKTAELVWEFYNEPKTFSRGMGGTQRLSNGNTVIGWGQNITDLKAVSEVRIDGTLAFELSLPESILNYKVFRFPWRTNLFLTDPDSVSFDYVPVGDSSTIAFELISNSSKEINITGFFNREKSYNVEHTVPFILPPYSSESIKIKFKPTVNGYFKDTLHIRSDTDSTRRITQVMVLTGQSDSTTLSNTEEYIVNNFVLEQNYPNPFNASTTIKYQIPFPGLVNIKVYDTIGNEIVSVVNEEKPAGAYKVEFVAKDLTSGIYFYQLKVHSYNGVTGSFVDTKKMILLK
jgi:hypothetical protein